MNTYKLSNTIKKDLLEESKWMHYDTIKCQKLSFAFLNKLFSTYHASWCWKTYCCKGEDFNCSSDGWNSYEDCCSEEESIERNRREYDSIRKELKQYLSRKKIGHRSIFVAENKQCVVVVIPMRDLDPLRPSDTWLYFDKTHPFNIDK